MTPFIMPRFCQDMVKIECKITDFITFDKVSEEFDKFKILSGPQSGFISECNIILDIFLRMRTKISGLGLIEMVLKLLGLPDHGHRSASIWRKGLLQAPLVCSDMVKELLNIRKFISKLIPKQIS